MSTRTILVVIFSFVFLHLNCLGRSFYCLQCLITFETPWQTMARVIWYFMHEGSKFVKNVLFSVRRSVILQDNLVLSTGLLVDNVLIMWIGRRLRPRKAENRPGRRHGLLLILDGAAPRGMIVKFRTEEGNIPAGIKLREGWLAILSFRKTQHRISW